MQKVRQKPLVYQELETTNVTLDNLILRKLALISSQSLRKHLLENFK
jgi:hypothetical protein